MTAQLGQLPERAPIDWRGHGLSWALADSMASQRDDAWTADDVARAFSDGAARGIAAERVRCAVVARNGCLVPPDGGSPTEDERLLCEEIARRILAKPAW